MTTTNNWKDWRDEFRQMAANVGLADEHIGVAEQLTFYFLACQSGHIKKMVAQALYDYFSTSLESGKSEHHLYRLISTLEEKEKEL